MIRPSRTSGMAMPDFPGGQPQKERRHRQYLRVIQTMTFDTLDWLKRRHGRKERGTEAKEIQCLERTFRNVVQHMQYQTI